MKNLSKRLKVLSQIHQTGLLPLFYNASPEVTENVVKACFEGGATCVEFTNRGLGALEVFREVKKNSLKNLKELSFGVGSIVDAPTAAMFLDAGADFIVSPCFDKDVAKLCNARKVAYMPGCATVTEIHQAHLHGVDVCKIFPGGTTGGPDFIKAVKAPLPWASLMPTGGISPTRESLEPWFKAGITCAGMGSRLITTQMMESGAYENMKDLVVHVIATIKEIRS